MPELPEVETVLRSLAPHLIGRTLLGIEVLHDQVIRRPERDVKTFQDVLIGARIEGLLRRGKYLIFVLSEERWLVVHLRMTGKLLWKPSEAALAPHTHVIFALDDGQRLVYEDVRRFGGLALWQQDPFSAPPLSLLGPEPLSADFSGAYLYEQLQRRKASVKSMLLDQHVVSGLGNIYVDEALFAAGIRPRKRSSRLTRRECMRLSEAVKTILSAAIAQGGSSIRNYRDGLDQSGVFQDAHQVYGRSGQPCCRCGTVLKRVTVSGRSSVYCPRCQKS